jgi:hypothetical protein
VNSKRLNPHTSHYFSASEAHRTSVTFHVALPVPQKLLNSIKEWGRYGVSGAKGLVYGDG